jgi:hypothetical protein
MADPRRVGHAQRRRMGAPSNVYAATMKPPTFSPGDPVQAAGRYRDQVVSQVVPNVTRPSATSDGHGYVVKGGKTGRETMHLSGELRPFRFGQEEAT